MQSIKSCLLGLDLGTTTIKGVLLSFDGIVLAKSSSLHAYDVYGNGQIEFDAERFYSLVAGVIRNLVESVSEEMTIEGICMASASGNTLIVNEDGKPLMKAICWMDTRVTDEITQVFGDLSAELVYKVVGWPLHKMFPLAHLSWLKQHQPLLLEKTKMICMTTEYILFKLTGCWGIDPSSATTFYLQDQVSGKWHTSFLDKLGINEDVLPPILPTGSILGEVTVEASRITGLKAGMPVILGAFDHPCAARGAGVLTEGNLLLSCGTSWVGFYPVKNREMILSQKLLTDPFLQPEGPWGAMFSLPAIATKVDQIIIRWITDKSDRYKEFDNLAAMANPGADGLMINPFLAEETVLENYKKQNIARAIMEGTAFLIKNQMDTFTLHQNKIDAVTMVGGPSETYPWPQIVCDVLGIPVNTVYGTCAGAVGAAILVGIGTGVYADLNDAQMKMSPNRKSRTPSIKLNDFYQERNQLFLKNLT